MEKSETAPTEANLGRGYYCRQLSDTATFELFPRQSYEVNYVTDSPSIGFAFDRQTGVHSFASSQLQTFTTSINSFAFVPKDCDVYSCSEEGGEYLRISLHLDFVRNCPQQRLGHDVVPSMVNTFYRIRKALMGADDPIQLNRELDKLWFGFDHCLKGDMSAVKSKSLAFSSLEDWIEDHLSHYLPMDLLAARVGLSTAYFSRSFKHHFGTSPHDYIIHRRLSKARQMLANAHKPLVDIALDCGFASHAHMSATFQRYLGVSPSSLRARN